MSLYDAIRGAQQPVQPQNIQQALQQIKQDPRSFVEQAGYNVPAGVTDPRQMVAQLMNSGQIPPQRANMIRAVMQRMGLQI